MLFSGVCLAGSVSGSLAPVYPLFFFGLSLCYRSHDTTCVRYSPSGAVPCWPGTHARALNLVDPSQAQQETRGRQHFAKPWCNTFYVFLPDTRLVPEKTAGL